jgi:hypothetical protein
MPSRRSICVVNNSSPIATAGVVAEVIVMPSSTVDPEEHQMTETTKNSRITPTPPPKQSKQQKLSLKGGGQLTLAAQPNAISKKNTTIKKLSVNDSVSKIPRQDPPPLWNGDKLEALPDDAVIIHDRTAAGDESSDSQAENITKGNQKANIREKTDIQLKSDIIDVGRAPNISDQQSDEDPTKTVADAVSANEAADNAATISVDHSDFEHYSRLEKRYTDRQQELIQKANEDSEANENFPLLPIDLHEDGDDGTLLFPNRLVGPLAAFVQGR